MKKKVLSDDVERLLNNIEDKLNNTEVIPPVVLKRGPNLTQEERNEKLKYYLESLYQFHVTRQNLLSPFEERMRASLEAKLNSKGDAKKLLFEKQKLNRIDSQRKLEE